MHRSIRVILGPPRSATSAIQAALCEAEKTHGLYEPLIVMKKLNQHGASHDEYIAYKNPGRAFEMFTGKPAFGKKNYIFVLKEAIGKTLKPLGKNLFPYSLLKGGTKENPPMLFIFRDPVNTFNSIIKEAKKRKDTPGFNQNAFIDLYRNCYGLYKHLQSQGIKIDVLTYEKFIKDPARYFNQICKNWGLEYTGHTVNWKNHGPDIHKKLSFHPFTMKQMKKRNFHANLFGKKGIYNCNPATSELILDTAQKHKIHRELRDIYRELCETTDKNFLEKTTSITTAA